MGHLPGFHARLDVDNTHQLYPSVERSDSG